MAFFSARKEKQLTQGEFIAPSLVVWEDTSALRSASVSYPLPVQVVSGSESGVQDNTITVTTAGTPVQLPDIACKRVFIQAHEDNSDAVVIGSSTVVAAKSGRRGMALFASQGDWVEVSNTNLLYVDAVSSGDKIHFLVIT